MKSEVFGIIERICLKVVIPVSSGVLAFSAFTVSFDYTEARRYLPNWPGLFDFLEHPKWLVVLVISGVLSMLGSWLVALGAKTRKFWHDKFRAEEEKTEAFGELIQFTTIGFLWSIGKRMGLAESSTSRISLYLYEDDRARFSFCARRSSNPTYERKGRGFFPANEGCIGKALEHGWCFDAIIPADPKDARKYLRDTYGMNAQTATGLNMKPSLIAAKKVLDTEDRPIAVLVVESVNRNEFQEVDLQAQMTHAASDLSPMILQLREYFPSAGVAEDEGF